VHKRFLIVLCLCVLLASCTDRERQEKIEVCRGMLGVINLATSQGDLSSVISAKNEYTMSGCDDVMSEDGVKAQSINRNQLVLNNSNVFEGNYLTQSINRGDETSEAVLASKYPSELLKGSDEIVNLPSISLGYEVPQSSQLSSRINNSIRMKKLLVITEDPKITIVSGNSKYPSLTKVKILEGEYKNKELWVESRNIDGNSDFTCRDAQKKLVKKVTQLMKRMLSEMDDNVTNQFLAVRNMLNTRNCSDVIQASKQI
jgi:hypothetical protein